MTDEQVRSKMCGAPRIHDPRTYTGGNVYDQSALRQIIQEHFTNGKILDNV
jgi:hypothetical protein